MRCTIDKLILEGPDLSGKSTLYSSIHKASGFRWNIQDRSSLSMVCYARQFGRDETDHRRSLEKELTNLNNRFVILLPSISTLRKRLCLRGDDIQTFSSLQTLHKIFETEVIKIQNLPNVLVVSETQSLSNLTQYIIDWLSMTENVSAESIGKDFIARFLEGSHKNEHTLSVELTGKILHNYDRSILEDDYEGEYFTKILSDFKKIISDELCGKNEYKTPQGLESRRFYYSSRTCISSLHLKPRGNILEFLCTLRSTNAIKNGDLDLRFLELIVHEMKNVYFSQCEDYRIVINMNSAHILE